MMEKQVMAALGELLRDPEAWVYRRVPMLNCERPIDWIKKGRGWEVVQRLTDALGYQATGDGG